MEDHDLPVVTDLTDVHVATAMTAPVLDASTGVLARAPFLRVADGLRHAADDAFAVVVATFDAEVPVEAGAALRSVVQAGDVTARWSARRLVVLSHPATPGTADATRAAVAGALGPLGAVDVDVRLSGPASPTPLDLLDGRPAPLA
jgi:hypothetical protein